MNENRQKLLHIRSSVLNKVPSGSQIDFGEIAVNYAEGHEFLSIKNTKEVLDESSTENIAIFSSDEVLKTNIIPPIISGCTDQVIDETTSASTNPVATKAVVNYTYDKNTIDEKIGSGGTFDPTQYYTIAQTNSAISGYAYSKNDTSGKTEIQTALDKKLDITELPTKTSQFINDGENGTSSINIDTTTGPYTKDTTKSISVGGVTLYSSSMSPYTYVSNEGWVENVYGIRAYDKNVSIAITNVTKGSVIWFYHNDNVNPDTYRNIVNAELLGYFGDVVRFKMYRTGTFKVEMRYGGSFSSYITRIVFETITNRYIQESEVVKTINSTTSASTNAVSTKAVVNYTYSKSEIEQKVASGGTFDPTQYYTIAQTNSAISGYAYSKNDIVTELGYEAFSTSSTYSVGDVVRYNDTTLYKFVVDHQAGAWDSSQVVQTSVNELIQDTFDPTQYYTKSEIEDMENVVASSLNDLNTNKVDGATMSAFTYSKDEIDTKISSGGTFDPTQYYTKTEINSNEKVIAKALNDLNNYRMFNVGSNTVNSLNGIPTTKRLVIASGITSSNNTLILDGVLQEGYEMYIIVNGTSDTAIVLDSNMINTSGEPITINSNGYCEISIISVSNGETYYVRGV